MTNTHGVAIEPAVSSLPLLIDTHAHLDDQSFEHDAADAIQRARNSRVEVILMSTHISRIAEVLKLAERHRLHCAAGVHPNAAGQAGETLEARIREAASHETVVAVGEIGLDYYRDHAPRSVQHHALRRQLALAVELNLPVVLHNRQATPELMALLKEFPGIRGVFHCFMGDAQEAKECLDLGFYLGIGGPITFAKNQALRQTVRALPLHRLVLETDSPYLTPVPHRGRRNEPAYVRHVADALAALKELPIERVAAQTTHNACALFGLPLILSH